MEEKKRIDRLYQEKFKDFEATPREAVWKNLSSRLQEKERKKSLAPLWYRIAGVAAVLAILINYANGFFRTSGIQGSASVVSTQPKQPYKELDLTSLAYQENMLRSSIILQALMLDTQTRGEVEKVTAPNQQQAVRRLVVVKPLPKSNQLIFNPVITMLATKGSLAFEEEQETIPEITSNKIPLPITQESNNNETPDRNLPVKRLRVTTTAAPVYYDNFGKGSSIDTRFANNESGGEISMAYGINFAYQLSEKIKIRSGVSKVDLSYNTRNIAFTATVNPVALSGINYNGEIPNYRIENTRATPFSNTMASTEFNRSSLASPASGFINQRLGFIEVPVELEYVILDSKIGINLIGGGSTLFLDENMISLNSANFSTNLGEANNLNAVSFSTNIGIGVDYKISPQFQLNLEPIFKYQINTFNNTSSLNPYYFGIYSGFSFKF